MKISRTVQLADLYRLGEQIEDDRSVSLQSLRQRDHDIGSQCAASGDVARLQYWLDHAPRPDDSPAGRGGPFTSERSVAVIARLVAAILGFLAMSTFLLASGRGLVNVFVFLLLFVLVQFLFSATALSLMLLSGRGSPPVLLPMNPARLFVSRMFPDGRYLRECQSVLRLLLLRYGQEFGALFTVAAMAAFLGVLAFSQFTFVWSSTFNLSDALVGRLTDLLATPWSSWLSGATLSAQTIADTRYHPALTHLDRETIASMRGWWPFLGMSMLTYALLPRVILWQLSRVIYTKTARRSFTRYPGAESILTRMNSPVVSTQAREPEGHARHNEEKIEWDKGLMLLNWAGALEGPDQQGFTELRAVPPDHRLCAGLGSLRDDALASERIDSCKPERLLVAVKSWEPPMADLRDFLHGLQQPGFCKLCLVPLPGRAVAERNMQEWRNFARQLPFDLVDAQELLRL